ncbi:MAG TPA: hypothetical protein VHX59_21280 [Mycobacteriales bacterium]|jgi:ABC-2 type transport system permease protein|nr:hypothetical protein [Mycobacteriales bacterium]
MKDALHAEWTKLRTAPGPAWLLLAAIALTITLSAIATTVLTYTAVQSTVDTTKLALAGIYLGQTIIAILAVGIISGEYATGMIRVTFAATPHRITVLTAKATTLTGLTLVAGTIAMLGSLLAGRYLLPHSGFTTGHGYPLLSLTHTATLRAAAGSVLYLALIGLLSLGIATAVRESAAAIGLVLALLYLFPILIRVVSDPHWQRHLKQIAPMNAGLEIQATTGLHHLPIGPWAGLGVLTAWTAGALLLGTLLLKRRDA